jgi:HlyD family secretion protein
MTEVVNATGVLQPAEMFPVGSELVGRVAEVLTDYNQVVVEGQVLLRLDDQSARQRLRQAEVGVELARVGVRQADAVRKTAATAVARERLRSPEIRRQLDLDLVESHLRDAEVGLEAARVRVQQAEEERRQAELALRRNEITAPVLGADGGNRAVASLSPDAAPSASRRGFVVLDRRVAVNQQVSPQGPPLFTLAADLEQMQVHIQVAEGDIGKVARGMAVEFTAAGAGDDHVFKGTVEELRPAPVSDHGAVFYKVIAAVRNERDPATGEWRLRPGATATVEILRRTRPATWKVPLAALHFEVPVPLSKAAQAKLAHGQPGSRGGWQPVWVLGADGRPWPVFARLRGSEPGLEDGQFQEALEWDADLNPRPDPADPTTHPRLLIGIQSSRKAGLFNPPKIKL